MTRTGFRVPEHKCPRCGAVLLLARREPHPARGLPDEIATLECPKQGCGAVATVEVGVDLSTGPLTLIAA